MTTTHMDFYGPDFEAKLVPVFDTTKEGLAEARAYVRNHGGVIYTQVAEGVENALVKGVWWVNRCQYVVLPADSGDLIPLNDDEPTDEDDPEDSHDPCEPSEETEVFGQLDAGRP